MTLDIFAWIAPFISVAIFSVFERNNKNLSFNHFDKRTKTILSILFVTLILNLLLSFYFLGPLVKFVAPSQLISFSELDMPRVLNFILCFLLIDFVQYLMHRIHHQVPFLWRLHRLHHSEKEVDSYSTFLHHPVEALLVFILLTIFFVIFDIPVIVILVYSIVQGLHSAFTHSKILVPQKIDFYLRRLIITPNAHRLHHSLDKSEGNTNFGQLFLIWDKLLGTYEYRTN